MDRNKHLRLCVDRPVPYSYAPAKATLEKHLRAGLPVVSHELDAGAVQPVMRMAIIDLKKWPAGSTLHCRFLDGSPVQRKKVEAKAHLWEEYANINFRFVERGDAEIRISFQADAGSWSALGNDALVESYFPKFQPTMNFGWLRDDTEDKEYERVVVHEFGHALGCIHEHQSPVAGMKWNKAEVYRYFSGPPNFWSKAEIDSNVIDRYNQSHMLFSEFDRASIMLYHFPAELFTDHKGTPMNCKLSETDKRFIAQVYPKAAKAAPAKRR